MAKNETVGSLQEMINANAEEKLTRDLRKFKETVVQNPLLDNTWNSSIQLALEGEPMATDGSPIYASFTDLLNEQWGKLWKKMYAENIDSYIQTETEELFAKIEQLRKDVDGLEYKSNRYSED